MILTHPTHGRSPQAGLVGDVFAMALIACIPLDFAAAEPWAAFVRLACEWADAELVDIRDAVVLVPFVQHLNSARRAWHERAAGCRGSRPHARSPAASDRRK